MIKNKKRIIKLVIFIIIAICIYSWFHVSGKDISGVANISDKCTVKIKKGFVYYKEYLVEGEQIEKLKSLIMKSSFTKDYIKEFCMDDIPTLYTITIDFNDTKEPLIIDCSDNKSMSIPNQFKYSLKINNKNWEATLNEIISNSKIIE